MLGECNFSVFSGSKHREQYLQIGRMCLVSFEFFSKLSLQQANERRQGLDLIT